MAGGVLCCKGFTKFRDVWMRVLNVSFLASGLFQEVRKVGGDLGYIYIYLFFPLWEGSQRKQKNCDGQ